MSLVKRVGASRRGGGGWVGLPGGASSRIPGVTDWVNFSLISKNKLVRGDGMNKDDTQVGFLSIACHFFSPSLKKKILSRYFQVASHEWDAICASRGSREFPNSSGARWCQNTERYYQFWSGERAGISRRSFWSILPSAFLSPNHFAAHRCIMPR
jgi:hypothetical protein